MQRPYRQVDVFTTRAYRGNPVAVVLDGDGPRRRADAAVRALDEPLGDDVRAAAERRPAPTTGCASSRPSPSCRSPAIRRSARATPGSRPAASRRRDDVIVQECDAGLVAVRRTDDGLAFAAPPLLRSGPVEDALVERDRAVLGIERAAIVDAQWADNGPGWVAVLLESADAVLALEPSYTELDIGAVGAASRRLARGVRGARVLPKQGAIVEDPVTGSLNASLAEWLLRTGRATAPYVASQGTVLGRAGRVHISQDADGTIWVGGGTVTCVGGEVEI